MDPSLLQSVLVSVEIADIVLESFQIVTYNEIKRIGYLLSIAILFFLQIFVPLFSENMRKR
jgi:hypothetical protein